MRPLFPRFSQARAGVSASLALLLCVLSPGPACFEALAADSGSRKGPDVPPLPRPIAAASPIILNASDLMILSDLTKNPPQAVIFDYDGTLTGTSENGWKSPASQTVIEKQDRILEAGLPVGILTGRSYDLEPSPAIPSSLRKEFLDRIKAKYLRNVFFSGLLGGELVLFDGQKGRPIRVLDSDWDPEEKERVNALVSEALREMDPSKKVETVAMPGYRHIAANDEAAARRLTGLLSRKLQAAGLPYPVVRHKNYMQISRFNKGDGLRLIYAAMQARGFSLSPDGLLYVADNFTGADKAAALALHLSRFIDVGHEPALALPANVKSLSIKGYEGSMLIADAVLAGIFKDNTGRSRRPAPPISKSLSGGPGKPSIILALAGLAATTAACILMRRNPDAASLAGNVLIAALGVPQVIKNFRKGAAATKDLALTGNLIWFGAAVLLLLSNLLRHSDRFWIYSNLAGVVESGIIISQIAYHDKGPATRQKALTVCLGVSGIAIAALTLGIMGFGPGSLAGLAFNAAMGLILILSWPQIRQNYLAYTQQGQAPSGLAWTSQMLLLAGSLLSMIPALTKNDAFWIFNNLVAMAAAISVLGQIFLTGPTNAVLKPFMLLWNGIKKIAQKN